MFFTIYMKLAYILIGGVTFMRYMSVEDLRTEQLSIKLKERISQIGRWHSKRRKADTTRIWKKLFADIESLLKDEKHPFTSRAYIILTVYSDRNWYALQVHKHNTTLYHGVTGKKEEDGDKVIRELNSLLAHYNLALIETPESQKRHSYRSRSSCKDYELKFAETIE